MTTRAQGRKKSLFPGIDGVPDGATFDFVYGGTNLKIPIADLLTALNVIGTIVQLGDITAVPVLDVQGTVHRIRNLETDAKSGIKVTVSATEGAYLALDAQTAGAGTPVLNTLNKIRRIAAGGGIDVQLVNDDITISTTGSGPALTTGIIANPGGGQAAAVELTTNFNVVALVTTAKDSIKLPPAAANTSRTLINQGGNALDLYPATGDAIDGAAINVPISVAVGGTVTLYSYDATNWVQI